MGRSNLRGFDCQLYVPMAGFMRARLPRETGPRRVVTFEPIDYDALVDPSFRRLLAVFDSSPVPPYGTNRVGI